jgi:hypothetical protein
MVIDEMQIESRRPADMRASQASSLQIGISKVLQLGGEGGG